MTVTATAARTVTVDLATGHSGPDCLEMAGKLHRQLSNGYTHRVSAMPLPADFDGYLAEHRTVRKRAARAERLGYRFEEIDRHLFETDVYEINTSMPERQERPMSQGYLERPHFPPNPKRCNRHHVYTYGVIHDVHSRRDLFRTRLVAYLWLYRCGELAMVSSILGHADHLEDGVMYLLIAETIRAQTDLGGTLFYNLHSSGTDGLRFFKERIGLAPTEVQWLL